MDIQFGNLISLNLLWVVASLVGLMMVAATLRRRALARFATSNLVQRLTSGISGPRRVVKAALVIATLTLLTVALTDPRWGKTWREVPQKGIDVMFVVDVSRSMLAEDATPSRLGRARQQIADMLDAMHGDRVGLVAFAGDAKQVSPLTTNYHDFQQTLSAIGPHTVLRGGSRLGDALTLAAKGFLDQTDDHKAIIVFTDGEDQESDPVDVAQRLHDEQGIRIFTVGLGDREQGARIPVARNRSQTQWLQHDGEQVWSKMNGTTLKQVALAADGAWIPAGTKQVDMADIYRSYVGNIEQAEFETARINSDIPRHQWFIGLALLLLVIETLLLDRRRVTASGQSVSFFSRRTEPSSSRTAKRRGHLVASAMVLVLFNMGAAASSDADDASSLVAQANTAVEAGDYEAAIDQYRLAAEARPDRAEPIYNEAVAHYRNGDLESARQLFTQSLASPDRELEAKARFNLANCDYAEAVATAEQDRDAAITKLESAISHYRGALEANPSDSDTRVNIELANRLIDQLRQQQKEEEQQQQQQQNQEQQDDQSQQSESQQSDSEQSDSQQNDQSQDSQQQQSSEESQSSESQEQQSSESESQESESQGQQSSDDGQSDDQQSGETQKDAASQGEQDQETAETADEQQLSSGDEQAESEDEPQQPGDQESESESSTDSAENAEPQTGEEAAESEPQQHAPEQTASGQPQEPSGEESSGVSQYGQSSAAAGADAAQPMTQIEADKMLQAIRDRDLRRRLERLRAERSRSVPVDRDW